MTENSNPLNLLKEDMVGRGFKLDIINRYIWAAKDFMRIVGKEDNFTEREALKYFAYLREKRKLKSYFLQAMHKMVKKLYLSMGLEWELKPPEVDENLLNTPQFTLDEVRNLIIKAKQRCNFKEVAWLSASTTYGLRRIELARISPEDITEGSIIIKTGKRGDIYYQKR